MAQGDSDDRREESSREIKAAQKAIDKHVGSKGQPALVKPSVPGYDHASGTPGYVSKPAKAAAAKAK